MLPEGRGRGIMYATAEKGRHMIDCICWKCEHKASVPDGLAGTSQKCPHCGATRSVPSVDRADLEPLPPQEASYAVVWGLLGSVLLLLLVVIIVYFVWAAGQV